ncbi:MAG: hypothetical protein E7585_02450 [Ruminococcaceae bacterium]|nr:hypothetical protein [Oscillospiraceae bacterium]
MRENRRIFLNGEWQLRFTEPFDGKTVESTITIPGNVEPTLQKLGLLEDYMPADSLHATTPFTAVDDWSFSTAFAAPQLGDGERCRLCFAGIDTVGTVYLNGEWLFDCQNMHMTYTTDVTDRLRPENTLTVRIRSSELWARERPHEVFSDAHGNRTSFYDSQCFLRKARHQWGWDNAPRLLTCGIVGDVSLELLPPNRFEEVYVYTRFVSEKEISVGASFRFATDRKYLINQRLRFSLLDGERVVFSEEKPLFFTQGRHYCKLNPADVELWWPAGLGPQKLYTVLLEVLEGDLVLTAHRESFGIRTVKLERTADIDEKGNGRFQFYVNGIPIFVKGTNWKPLDPLASAAHRKTAEGKALAELTALHCNMVRIWGGGIYEEQSFFDYCDRHGILVWQDFMLACEIPTRDRAYGELVAKEAEQVIKRLRNHPSLAVWCGDNENDEHIFYTMKDSCLKPSYQRISREVLPEAVLRHDPFRPYVESSPLVSDAVHERKVGYASTEKHLYAKPWEFAEALRNCRSFFLGETGPIGTNAITLNEKALARERKRALRLWDSSKLGGADQHQSDEYFVNWRLNGKESVLAWFGRDFSFEEIKDYALALNVVCAENFKDVIEYSRATRPRKTGVLWWSLYDMWPMLFNYSVIDWEGNRKLPYYWIRQSQQDVLLMAVREDLSKAPVLYAANNTLQKASISYTVTAYNENGEGRELACGVWEQSANSTAPILTFSEPSDPELWVIRWQLDGKEYTNHFFTGKAPFETYRRFVRILSEAGGFAGELLELS